MWTAWLPAAVVGMELLYGATLSTPTEIPSTKNSTLLTVTGAPTVARAVSAKDCPAMTLWPFVGLLRLANADWEQS
jgi:hypothetical protein